MPPILNWRYLLPAPAPRPLCIHCRRYKKTRPRGLCRKCHEDKSIRKLYPTTSPHGRRMKLYPPGPRPLARKATLARPGSPEKIAVLRERVGRGQSLHHPNDAPMDPELRGLGVRH